MSIKCNLLSTARSRITNRLFRASTSLFVFTFALAVTFPVAAQTDAKAELMVCGVGPAIREREILRVPPAHFYKDEYGESVYTINGNESWRSTEIEVKHGQKIDISANGIVRWAPDGIEKIDVTPDGTRPPYRDGWNFNHFPYPDAGIGSLVMRIGKGIYPVGSSAVIVAADDGSVEFMVNDDVLADNSGWFSVKVNVRQN